MVRGKYGGGTDEVPGSSGARSSGARGVYVHSDGIGCAGTGTTNQRRLVHVPPRRRAHGSVERHRHLGVCGSFADEALVISDRWAGSDDSHRDGRSRLFRLVGRLRVCSQRLDWSIGMEDLPRSHHRPVELHSHRYHRCVVSGDCLQRRRVRGGRRRVLLCCGRGYGCRRLADVGQRL